MSTQTDNLHLVKPADGEIADIGVINSNMDIIDGSVLPLSGGTLTGSLFAQTLAGMKTDANDFAALRVKFANGEYNAIRFYGGDSEYGHGVCMGAGGLVIVGAGESAGNLYQELIDAGTVTPDTEQMYVTSDNNVTVHTACQTIANKKTFTFDTNGVFFSQGIVLNPGALSNYNEGVRFNRANSGWATIMIGGAAGSTSGTGDNVWLLGSPPTSTGRFLYICHNSSSKATYFSASNSGNTINFHNNGWISSDGGVYVHNTSIDRDASVPNTDQWGSCLNIQDTNEELIAQVRVCRRASTGRIDSMLSAYNEKSDGTAVENRIQVSMAKDGTSSYYVTNAAAFRSAIGAAASSDRRLKSDISPLGDDALEFVDALEPCVYTINGERQVGLIAQDVHEADPWDTRMAFETQEGIDGLDDWEKMDDGSPTWKLDYIRVIPPLVAAVQNANRRIESLESEVAELRAIVAELSEQVGGKR